MGLSDAGYYMYYGGFDEIRSADNPDETYTRTYTNPDLGYTYAITYEKFSYVKSVIYRHMTKEEEDLARAMKP